MDELQPQHHAAVRMRLDGVRPKEIADRLDVKERTVHLWFSDPLVKTALAHQVARINELFQERMAEASCAVVNSLVEIATAELSDAVSPETKLRAGVAILDRLPPPRASTPLLPTHVTNLEDAPADSLLGVIGRMTPAQRDALDAELSRRLGQDPGSQGRLSALSGSAGNSDVPT